MEPLAQVTLIQVMPQKSLKDILANADTDWKEFLDTVEKSKYSDEDIDTTLNEFDELEMMLCGLKEKIRELSSRKIRIQEKMDNLKTFIIYMMQEKSLNTLKKPCYTISVRKLTPSIVIEDESEIPSKYFKVSEPIIDKKFINQDIKDGIDIPGISIPTEKKLSLSIRKN